MVAFCSTPLSIAHQFSHLNIWSPNDKREATLGSRLITSFHVEGLKESMDLTTRWLRFLQFVVTVGGWKKPRGSAPDLQKSYIYALWWCNCSICQFSFDTPFLLDSIFQADFVLVGSHWSEEDVKQREDNIQGQHTQCLIDACNILLM